MTPLQQIEAIDKQIDAIRAALYRRIGYMPATASDFQAAWDRNPLLHAKQEALYAERGAAQTERDAQINRDYDRSERRRRAALRRAA